MKFGYARVSTANQAKYGYSLEDQESKLLKAGVEESNIFIDEGVSGAKSSRPQLDRMLDKVRHGDVIVSPSLSRLSRNLNDLIHLVNSQRSQGVEFLILAEGIDTTKAAGRLQMGIFGSLAEYERELIKERTAIGLERARAAGKLGGRKPKYGSATLKKVERVSSMPALTVKERAAACGVSVATYYRLLKQLENNDE